MVIVILILTIILCILWVVKFKELSKAPQTHSCDPIDPDHGTEALRARQYALRNRRTALMKRSKNIEYRIDTHIRKEDALYKFIHSTTECARELDAAIFVQLRGIIFEKDTLLLELREIRAEFDAYKDEFEAIQIKW